LTGGHRAALNADWLVGDVRKVVPVSLNASGKVVKGTAGQSGFVGVVILTKALKANDIVDVMQDGEVVEMTGLIAGQKYFAAADGNSLVPASGTITGLRLVGWTVEAGRLVVRCQVAGNVV
jgi:hypothetical protein